MTQGKQLLIHQPRETKNPDKKVRTVSTDSSSVKNENQKAKSQTSIQLKTQIAASTINFGHYKLNLHLLTL